MMGRPSDWEMMVDIHLTHHILTIQKPKKATIKLLMVVYDVIILYGF